MTIDGFALRRQDVTAQELRQPGLLPTEAGVDVQLGARIRELTRLVTDELDTIVVGARGEATTARQAVERIRVLQGRIQMDEVRGSRRHRTVSRLAKVSALVFLCIIDVPIMLWLTAAVFNVNWARPMGMPLAVSVVVTALATAGSAASLYHLGHVLRENKNARGGLDWRDLAAGARLAVLGVVTLVTLVATLMLVRLHTEGMLSGVPTIALLLALLVSVVMLVSSGLVFHTAFRDGSPERDDVTHYRKILERHQRICRGYDDEAEDLALWLEFLARPPSAGAGPSVGPARGNA